MARLSLCLIAGNEEAIIARMLDGFAPAFDELSLCRAVGASVPDKTAEIAAEWCVSHGKDFRLTEHKNSPGAEAWLHIDDFAAARNESFAAATGDWLFWADCDDLVAQPAKLRDVLELPDCGDVVRFPYDVIGTNKQPSRERAIRRTLFASGVVWRFAVHENLLVPAGTKMSEHPLPMWIHQPKINGTENRRRNKLILSRTLAHTSANYFYVHQEWFCEGNKHNAQKFGELALAFPDLDPSFRYEANLNLSRINGDSDVALRHALAAHAVFPWCREALAMCCLLSIERNDPERALHWALRLDATPLPAEASRPWTHEPKWYGWAAIDMLARCQRLAGKPEDAAKTQARFGPPLISLIHASRGRAARAAECRNQWLNLAANPERIQHILCIDRDDAPSMWLARQFEHVVSDAKSCVAAWNLGAAYSMGEILLQLSDDWIPVPGWDLKILAEADKAPSSEWVLAISDGHRTDDLLCMAILSRARYLKQRDESEPDFEERTHIGPAYMFCHEYESVYSDNEFSHRAWKDGVVIDARKRLQFWHLHPAFGKAPMDETYAHQNSKERYEKGAETFRRRNPDAQQAPGHLTAAQPATL